MTKANNKIPDPPPMPGTLEALKLQVEIAKAALEEKKKERKEIESKIKEIEKERQKLEAKTEKTKLSPKQVEILDNAIDKEKENVIEKAEEVKEAEKAEKANEGIVKVIHEGSTSALKKSTEFCKTDEEKTKLVETFTDAERLLLSEMKRKERAEKKGNKEIEEIDIGEAFEVAEREKLLEKVIRKFNKAIDNIKSFSKDVADKIKNIFKKFIEGVKKAWNKLKFGYTKEARATRNERAENIKNNNKEIEEIDIGEALEVAASSSLASGLKKSKSLNDITDTAKKVEEKKQEQRDKLFSELKGAVQKKAEEKKGPDFPKGN